MKKLFNYKMIAPLFATISLLISGCDHPPNPNGTIGHAVRSNNWIGKLTFGYFVKGFTVPIPHDGSNPMFYVQDGLTHRSLKALDTTRPFCVMIETNVIVDPNPYKAPITINSATFPTDDNFERSQKRFFINPAHIVITPTGVGEEYLVSITSSILFPIDDPYIRIAGTGLKFAANVSCTRTLSAYPETSKLTIGELNQIFGFIYKYDPPSV